MYLWLKGQLLAGILNASFILYEIDPSTIDVPLIFFELQLIVFYFEHLCMDIGINGRSMLNTLVT